MLVTLLKCLSLMRSSSPLSRCTKPSTTFSTLASRNSFQMCVLSFETIFFNSLTFQNYRNNREIQKRLVLELSEKESFVTSFMKYCHEIAGFFIIESTISQRTSLSSAAFVCRSLSLVFILAYRLERESVGICCAYDQRGCACENTTWLYRCYWHGRPSANQGSMIVYQLRNLLWYTELFISFDRFIHF